jgi:hypothetical protein
LNRFNCRNTYWKYRSRHYEYSITCQLQAPVTVIVVLSTKYAPYFAAAIEVVPPDKVLVPEYVGKDPGELKLPPGAPTEPPLGEYVPDVSPVPAAVPAAPVENDVTNDLLILTDEIVILPAEAAVPLWVELTVVTIDG